MGSQRLAANSPTRLKYFVLAKLLAKMATDIRLGSYRNTMLQNPLLRKAELGKPMQRGFELPGEEFIYGRPNHCIDGGAQEAMQYMVLQRQREKRDIKARQARHPVRACDRRRTSPSFRRDCKAVLSVRPVYQSRPPKGSPPPVSTRYDVWHQHPPQYSRFRAARASLPDAMAAGSGQKADTERRVQQERRPRHLPDAD